MAPRERNEGKQEWGQARFRSTPARGRGDVPAPRKMQMAISSRRANPIESHRQGIVLEMHYYLLHEGPRGRGISIEVVRGTYEKQGHV